MDSEPREIRAELRESLEAWREELLDLSKRNRLLNFRHTKASTLEIREPGYTNLLGRLSRGVDFAPLPLQKPDTEEESTAAPEPATTPRGPRSGILTQRPYQELLDKALARLRKQSRTTETETGIWILYLGVGFLRWKGPAEQGHSEAPLLLVPVEIDVNNRGRYRLCASNAAETLLNPALGIKLQEFGIDWSAVEDVPLDEAEQLIETVRGCVSEQPAWSVEEKVVLAPFTFHKETIYRDLKDNEEAILAHPVVRAVAASPDNHVTSPTLEYDLPPLEELDQRQEPELAPLVLDADAYQRRAVAAALDGRSFVMDGPPGTGKSQTIANVIATLIGAGRTVLFVSEKAAALEVVQSRLMDTGIDIAALSLHDGKTRGGAVAKSLDDSLHANVHPLPANLGEERNKARILRERLSGHARAVNEADPEVGLSLHQAMGRVLTLSRGLPDATELGMVEPAPVLFARPARERIVDTARSMTHVWDLLVSPEDSPWSGIRRADTAEEALDAALTVLTALSGHRNTLRRITGGEHPVSAKAARGWLPLLAVLPERDDIPGYWVTSGNFDAAVATPATEAVRRLSDLARLRARIDFDWQAIKDLPDFAELDSSAPLAEPSAVSEFGALTREQIEDTIRLCADWEARLAEVVGVLQEVVRRTELALPDDHTNTVRMTATLARVASGPHPLPHWLTGTSPELVRGLVTSFSHHRDRLRESRPPAQETFHDGVLELHDISALTTRLRLWQRAGQMLAERPEVPAAWLTATDFAPSVREPVLAARDRRHAHRAAVEDLGRVTALPWTELPAFDPVDPSTEVVGTDPETDAERARQDARFFSGWADRLTEVIAVTEETSRTLGCPLPGNPAQVRVLLESAVALGAAVRPLPAWLDEEEAEAAQTCLDQAEQAAKELHEARESAADLFGPQILDREGLPELHERLARYGGLHRLLGSAYREDKRSAATLTASGTWDKSVPERLPQAIRWQQAHRELGRQAEACEVRLGAHWRGEHTDFASVRAALRCAEGFRHVLAESDRLGLRRFLYHEQPLDPGAIAGARAALDELAPWAEAARTLLPAAAALNERSLSDASTWLTAAAERLTADAALADVLTPVLGASVTTGTARVIRDRVVLARRADEDVQLHAVADTKALDSYGDLLAARTRQELVSDLDWAERTAAELRAMITPVFGPEPLDVPGLASLRAQTLVENADSVTAEGTLGRIFKQDRALAAGLSHTGTWHPDLFDRIGDAQRWYEDHHALHGQAVAMAEEFGRYWREEATDAGTLTRAVDLADLCHSTLDPEERAALAEFLTHSDLTDLAEALDNVRETLSDWADVVLTLPRGAAHANGLAPGAALEWAEDNRALLERLNEQLRGFNVRTGREVTLAAADHEIVLAHQRDHAENECQTREQDDRALLGDLYGIDEHLDATLQDALTWTRRVRRLVTDAVGDSARWWPEDAVPALRAERSIEIFGPVIDDWERVAANLAALFDEPVRTQITVRLSGELEEAERFLFVLREDIASLERWDTLITGVAAMRSHGLGPLLERYVDAQGAAELWPAAVERTVLGAWADQRLREDDRLVKDPGPVRDNEIGEFRRRDLDLHKWARQEVLHRWADNRPSISSRSPGLAVIRREAEKKRRHMPVRRLMETVTWEAQHLTPCLMMSPLTVSMFLPSNIRFDVVIFDEASQVKPADAINCVYRGESLIVAGDQKQLPPTGFFDRAAGDDDEWDEEQQESFESLLDMCKASGRMRDIPLRWHYRSRHEDLIAFSNQKFYDSELITFPGAHLRDDNTGVAFFKVDGVYDRGGARNNRIEAREVADRVIHHFRTRPGQSLGVVALSREQANAIEDAVDKALDEHPELRSLADGDRLGGFFVKNLETVQGDERDVIILSIGYGPTADGRIRKNFGPINRADGYRRLNVAVTRARYRVEVVSSFSADDLRIGPDDAVGLRRLCEYLRYAEHGPAALDAQPVGANSRDAETESPFEDSVLAVLRDWGYEVHPQVGVAGYRIDLGVIDPDRPGRYMIGIECDGAMYHSSKVARDRDRLRDGVLTGLGWRLHRIWGTDWYRDRARAEQRLREAVEKSRIEQEAPSPRSAKQTPSEGRPRLGEGRSLVVVPDEKARARAAEEASRQGPDWLSDYVTNNYIPEREAFWYPPRSVDARPYIGSLFLLISEHESPLEVDWLYRKAIDALGGERLGRTTRVNFDWTLDFLVNNNYLRRDADTIWFPDGEFKIRRPIDDMTHRKVSEVPPAERQEALRLLVRDSARITRKDLLRAMCDTFDWGRSGKDITQAFNKDLEALLAKGTLIEGDGVIRSGT